MHRDKCQGCERCRWDYQWRANGCSSNLCASFSLTHCLPLEAPLTSLRDWGLFTDHWLNPSFSFPPAFPWSYEQDWGHWQAVFELFINRPNEKTNRTNNTKTWVLLLSCLPPPPSPKIRTLTFLFCSVFLKGLKNYPDHSRSCFMVSDSFQKLLTNNARWNKYIYIKLPSFTWESSFRIITREIFCYY